MTQKIEYHEDFKDQVHVIGNLCDEPVYYLLLDMAAHPMHPRPNYQLNSIKAWYYWRGQWRVKSGSYSKLYSAIKTNEKDPIATAIWEECTDYVEI